MKNASLILAMVALVFPLAALADAYEDNCVLAVSKTLPAAATIKDTRVSPAPNDLVKSFSRDTTFRWVRVDTNINVGGHKIAKYYICAQNRGGQWIVVPWDDRENGWVLRL